MRFRFSDLLLFVLVFVFVAAFPVDLLPIDAIYQLLVRIGLRAVLLTYYIYIIIRNRIKVFGIANIKNLLLCTPFFLVACSNIIAASIDGGFVGINQTAEYFALSSLYTLLIAISEEIVFRLFIHNALANASSVKRIFGSAAIFALMHLINIVNVSSVNALVTVLIQTVYTFGLGLLLGVLYEYSYSLTGAVILHFTFNFLNTNLYSYLGGNASVVSFYVTAIVSAVIVGTYAILITIFYFRKYSLYFRQ